MPSTMHIPNISDWGEIDEDDIELQWTFNEFFEKSFSEAEAIFESNALNYQEDLVSMPAAPFNFYAPALVKYITSEKAVGDCCGASSFLSMVSWMFKTRSHIIYPKTKQQLLIAAHHVANNQEFYEADEGVFGCFTDRLAEVIAHAG